MRHFTARHKLPDIFLQDLNNSSCSVGWSSITVKNLKFHRIATNIFVSNHMSQSKFHNTIDINGFRFPSYIIQLCTAIFSNDRYPIEFYCLGWYSWRINILLCHVTLYLKKKNYISPIYIHFYIKLYKLKHKNQHCIFQTFYKHDVHRYKFLLHKVDNIRVEILIRFQLPTLVFSY